MMTAKELKAIFQSPEYMHDLDELSAYAASIKQERPMVLLLSKYLWNRKDKYKFDMERSKCDLKVNGTRIEFKFNFDCGLREFKRTLDEYGGDIEEVRKAVQLGRIHKTRSPIPGIFKDMLDKKGHVQTDLFVWTICARDVTKLGEDDLKRVCIGKQQLKYNKLKPYGSNREFLDMADAFLEKLQKIRLFTLETATIATSKSFPSTYHLKICDFAET